MSNHLLSNRPQNKNFGRRPGCGADALSKITAENKEKYYESPTKCVCCGNVFLYERRNNKFCNQSCAAKYNNSIRSVESREKQRRSLVLSNESWKFSPVTFNQCVICNLYYRTTTGGSKYCSDKCRTNNALSDMRAYRRNCKFHLNNRDHAILFDSQLLEEYGWYRAANHPKGYNPNGATWDHLFRVEDGFKLQVSPDIMTHPANAEMIAWTENVRRRTSTITYEELLKRIENWK